jgi:putative ABC transport system permease protein
MLKNYVIIALRNLKRQFMYSFINIFGLAAGMACSLVIFLYVYGEWSHDRHFRHADRIYRIGVSFYRIGQFANGPELLKEYLPKEFEGIEAFTCFQRNPNEKVRIGEALYKEEVYYIDSSFFEVFSYDFVEGNAARAMLKPSSAVLAESMAKKYFGDAPALGRIIEVGNEKMPYVVTGIVKDGAHNSHMRTSVWVSRSPEMSDTRAWTSAHVYTYLRLRENVSEADLGEALARVIANQVYPASRMKQAGMSLEDYRNDENSVKFLVLPLRDIYLKSRAGLELSPGGNETNLYIFSIVALIILVLAAVNFINLSTARATRRAKEVGVRKALGTSHGRLVAQFLFESVMVSLFSMVLGLCFAELFAFVFYWITGQPLPVSLWANAWSAPCILLFSVAVGVLAGVYPAFYLTGFQPVKVLKGNLQVSRSQGFRNSLVVFQFSISITLIICTTVIIRQLAFISTKDLGFGQHNVITVDDLFHMESQAAITFRDKMLQLPGVQHASLHAGEPGSRAILAFYTYKTPEMQEALTINTYFGDHQYLDAMGFRLLQGRNFEEDLASDTASVILNESAVQALGIAGNPVGAEINKGIRVIGVVHDFHWESLRSTIAPAAILLIKGRKKEEIPISQLALKVNPSAIGPVLKAAETHWKQQVAGEPFQYHFLDENFGKLLQKEEVLGKAIGFFTVLAILISCLGLFGLAAYTTDQRTKEIGIRKVLGATVVNIVVMLNKQFTMLVLAAMLIAFPVSYYTAQQWLSGFAYRTELSVWIFSTGGIAGLLISYATVAFHSVKASRTNPSETLKCD